MDKKIFTLLTLAILVLLPSWALAVGATPVKAIYIPLADHYAGIVTYERYRQDMKEADFQIERMKSWGLLRAYFMSGEVDMAFVMSPLALDMFAEAQNFRWVGLMHRDGNALAINQRIKDLIDLPTLRMDRKPTKSVAEAFAKLAQDSGKSIQIAVPHLLATHSVVTYKFFKDFGYSLGVDYAPDRIATLIGVPPPKAPAFIKKQSSRGIAAAFEQSLPWADVVETQRFGHVAWYSKDVLPWPNGHVECIILVTDKAIKEKRKAVEEVINLIHQGGIDIELARRSGAADLDKIATMVRKHIPEHNLAAIIQSMRLDLGVINYRNLNVDKAGIRMIMDLAVEGGILKQAVDIEAFADESFSTEITEREF